MSDPALKAATVGRTAYFAGWAVGIGVALGGYHLIESFGWGRAASALSELAVMALAMLLTTGIWQISARLELASREAAADESAD